MAHFLVHTSRESESVATGIRVRPEDLKNKNARSGTSRMFAEAVLAADKVMGF